MAPRSVLMLQQQLKELQKKPPEFFSAGLADESNIYEWDVCITGPPDTLYEGGIFNCKMIFPETYPDQPPKMKFVTPVWHPNVYPNGDVCISILHPPGDDPTNVQETAAMRWNPIHTVKVLRPFFLLCPCCSCMCQDVFRVRQQVEPAMTKWVMMSRSRPLSSASFPCSRTPQTNPPPTLMPR